ncbi:MAG: hypothetical protein Crog4KO_29870 [Crocinitomicaceae bacterium]
MRLTLTPLIAFTTLILLSLTSCGSKRDYGKIYPEDLSKKVDFNMSISDFNALKGTSTADMQDGSFRWVYHEKVEGGDVTDIVYYFDKDGMQPLYEMIFIYNDTTARNAAADKLLGPPNHEGEWRFTNGPHTISAWKYKTKLILAALIPKTEWNEASD